jgi:arsenate reductase (glutaredoxin)
MKKVFHLSSCSTCQRILKETNAISTCTLQDIKTEAINEKDLDWLASKAGSYEALFSRKALKYRAMGLHEKTLSENDYRDLILQEYTFLKRPVFIVGDKVFIGNLAKTVAEAKEALGF